MLWLSCFLPNLPFSHPSVLLPSLSKYPLDSATEAWNGDLIVPLSHLPLGPCVKKNQPLYYPQYSLKKHAKLNTVASGQHCGLLLGSSQHRHLLSLIANTSWKNNGGMVKTSELVVEISVLSLVATRIHILHTHTHTHTRRSCSVKPKVSQPSQQTLLLLQICQKLLDLTTSSDSCWHSRLACKPLPTNQNRKGQKAFCHSLFSLAHDPHLLLPFFFPSS